MTQSGSAAASDWQQGVVWRRPRAIKVVGLGCGRGGCVLLLAGGGAREEWGLHTTSLLVRVVRVVLMRVVCGWNVRPPFELVVLYACRVGPRSSVVCRAA